jgi:hypothetical protein
MGRAKDDIDLVIFQINEGREWAFGIPDYLLGDAEPMPHDIVDALRDWCQEAGYWYCLVDDTVLALGRKDIFEHGDPLIDAVLWYGPMQDSEKSALFFTCPLDTPWVEGEMLLNSLDVMLIEMGYEIMPLPDEQLKNELCTDTLWAEDGNHQGQETKMTVLWPVDMLGNNNK